MAHPVMFDASDPLLARLREICLGFPDAAEKISHGRPNWYTTKVFAVFGGKVKGDHADPLLDRALLFLPDQDERQALEKDPRFHVPAYYGPAGWLALPLDSVPPPGQPSAGGAGGGSSARGKDGAGGEVGARGENGESVDWAEVAELVESSYRQTAGVRRVARLDAGR